MREGMRKDLRHGSSNFLLISCTKVKGGRPKNLGMLQLATEEVEG